jgi:predicted Rossmann-fold nucleotide-binding protein
MRILVCGGRDYRNVSAVINALAALHAKRPITALIEGGAKGADQIARAWAEQCGWPVLTFKADWQRHGKRAGPLRNARMIAEGRPDGVIAFPGGRGTADMVSQARAAGLTVWEPFKRGSA